MSDAILKNDLFLRTLRRESVERRPVWIMRQAGRYLPEYRALREQVPDFMTFCRTPELACEATLQPIDRFDLDAAIIFSDILVIPEAMGVPVHFNAGHGPQLRPVRTREDIQQLQVSDVMERLDYVMQAIRMTRQALNRRVPLIGFSGSPWTLATYMIEGQGSKEFIEPKKMLFAAPDHLHQLLNTLANAVEDYLYAQWLAGADVLMLFDSWGGILSTADYEHCSLHYMTRIIAGLRRRLNGQPVPIIVFTKNGGQWLPLMAGSGADALGCDWTLDLSEARVRVGDRVALQGNLDPSALFADAGSLKQAVFRVLDSYGKGGAHVFNLGHGIHQHTPIDAVHIVVEAVRSWSSGD